jgi:hypothetical protein
MNKILYRTREKLAYSRPGKFLATLLRDRYFPRSRVHWVQQALSDGCFWKLS